jgi:hypothetical protein
MGYMGFGLQRWIFTLKPRKPFKKRENTMGYDTLDDNFLDFDSKELAFKKRTKRNPKSVNIENLEERIIERKKLFRFNLFWDKAYNSLVIIILIIIVIIAIIKTTNIENIITQEVIKLFDNTN